MTEQKRHKRLGPWVWLAVLIGVVLVPVVAGTVFYCRLGSNVRQIAVGTVSPEVRSLLGKSQGKRWPTGLTSDSSGQLVHVGPDIWVYPLSFSAYLRQVRSSGWPTNTPGCAYVTFTASNVVERVEVF
jgi:hypothetical protein